MGYMNKTNYDHKVNIVCIYNIAHAKWWQVFALEIWLIKPIIYSI